MAYPSPRSLSFGSVAERYERYRPGYGDDVVDLLLASGPSSAIEVGAGTGKATRVVAARGVPVSAVEPDPDMAAVLARTTAGLPVTIVPTTFEQLHAEPVDLLYAAAAFHWTDPDTRWQHAAELLVPGGWFGCLGGPTNIADEALDAEVGRVRREAVGGERTSGARGSDDGTAWPANELRDSPLFDEVVEHDLTRFYDLAADDLIGQMSTVSAFIVLPDAQRDDVLGRIRAMLPDPVPVRRDLQLHLARRVA
ncbi:methyltransferase domain-containing protein [Nocardioides mangrovicus]|uniref:Methyltransferase domain-containing protein n=1 Tax=Nocardioides mangrovicus TaxID=2478913 RepID=A0A3L8P1F8_9ACTN|nr:class I SAM-dependent methyltransferase [Nocardioides mangrovicus]RLV49206.1 methyltransferase domain-containing protein [Nocardioides mangrovicus]